jgi:predicted TIM-barrel fold metal-dependent hydrolase
MHGKPERIVDLHTHFFNARYLPLAGIFANGLEKDAKDSPVARALAALVNHLTESDHLPKRLTTSRQRVEFYVDVMSNVSAEEWLEPSKGSPIDHDDPAQTMETTIRQLNEALPELGETPEAWPGEDKGRFKEWIKTVVKKALLAFSDRALPHAEIGNYIEFTFNMLTSERRMVATLIHGYGDGIPQPEFVHHMMDMQKAYECHGTTPDQVAPAYSLDKQLERMKGLASEYPGRVRGFAAFDPRRQAWPAHVARAIEDGFVGFKFYPAMGYRPFDDENESVRENIYAFFDVCIKKDIPVFVHCTPQGFETMYKKGTYADPRGWERLLAHDNGRFARLRLCLGHGGGGKATGGNDDDGYVTSPGWTAAPAATDVTGWGASDNYAATVVRLCRQYPNVYCDLAYLTELFEGTDDEQRQALARFATNLQRELDADAGAGAYRFADKVCFGTDWHMPSMVTQPRHYLNLFLELFSAPELAGYAERFFWKNAYAYMKQI